MKPNPVKNIDLKRFLSRHDMLWTRKPKSWDEAPFIGSGLVGSLLYFNGKNRLMMTVGDTSVYDNRLPTEKETDKMFLSPRLPLGRFVFGGVTRVCEMRLDIYRGFVTGTCKTLTGSYDYRCFAPHGKRLIVVDFKNVNDEFPVDWLASEAVSPRQKYMLRSNKSRASEDYGPPKSAYSYQHKDVTFCIQPLYTKGFSVVAYQVKTEKNGMRLIIATGQGTEEGIVASQLRFELENAFDNYDVLLSKHLQYWKDFYEKSFVALNDAAAEEFYWLQLYKLASAGCENGRIYDTCGPWLPEITAWPGAWWNLNVQLTYSPLFASNHTELVRPLSAELRDGIQELSENVPDAYRYDSAAIGRNTTFSLHSPASCPGEANATDETGNLLWALHTLWQYYQITQDHAYLRTTLFPLLKRAVSFYRHFLMLDKDGKLHIPPTLSPEYPDSGFDANYDLALLRWGLSSLLYICDALSMNESSYDEWKWILRNLTDYPADERNGFMIAADVPYMISHRHYSHLLMIHPLHSLDLTVPQNRERAMRSVAYWQSKPEALQGYSYAGAASMYAVLGEGDKAYEKLTELWNGGFITRNTMYSEGGNPVLETPCAAAAAVLDMLIQSNNGTISIFPALPKAWTDASVDSLACEGGFEVSAVYRGGRFLWADIRNPRSETGICRISIPPLENKETTVFADHFERVITFPTAGLRLKIPKGQSVLLCGKDARDFELSPVTYSEDNCHVYGGHKDSMI